MPSGSGWIFTKDRRVALALGGERGGPWSRGVSASYGCDPPGSLGNAAIILRSRLKVKVVKELRGKKMALPNGVTENGVLASDWDTEAGKQVMQYQVCGHVPQLVLSCLLASGRGRGALVGPQGESPLRAFQTAQEQHRCLRDRPPRRCSALSVRGLAPPGLKRSGD